MYSINTNYSSRFKRNILFVKLLFEGIHNFFMEITESYTKFVWKVYENTRNYQQFREMKTTFVQNFDFCEIPESHFVNTPGVGFILVLNTPTFIDGLNYMLKASRRVSIIKDPRPKYQDLISVFFLVLCYLFEDGQEST